MTASRPVIDIPTPQGGWAHPWLNVAEIAQRLTPADWTLIGGLMVSAHATLAGVPPSRVTIDVDMVVHLETKRGRAAATHRVLMSLGYALRDPRSLGSLDGVGHAHRYERHRGNAADIVDVMRADHTAPRVVERLAGHPMLPAEGATQALRRTFNARLDLGADEPTLVSVPDAYGALVLKAAAHMADSRDGARHLTDAVTLLACIDDPMSIAEVTGSSSDARRLRHLGAHLVDGDSPAWRTLSNEYRADARATLGILLDRLSK